MYHNVLWCQFCNKTINVNAQLCAYYNKKRFPVEIASTVHISTAYQDAGRIFNLSV